jgi:hypothetical protein
MQPQDSTCVYQHIVRHGYPWVPTDQAHGRARQVGSADQKTRKLTMGPTYLIHGPKNLPEDFSR